MSELYKDFIAAQKEFSPALKTSVNPHFRSKYADLGACVEAVMDALNNNGFALMQLTHECELGAKVETKFLHKSGESITAGMMFVPAGKKDAHGFGSALTYARRYSLMAACGIAPEDDDGNHAVQRQPSAQESNAVNANIAACTTREELVSIYKNFKKPSDQARYLPVIEARKAEIEKSEAANASS